MKVDKGRCRKFCRALWILFTVSALILDSRVGAPFSVASQGLSGTSAPLPLPTNPDATCTSAAFHVATSKEPSCSESIFARADPALYEYYGSSSSQPSSNCFCYAQYWTRVKELENTANIQLKAYLDFCGTVDYTIPYYQQGEGICAGRAAVREVTPTPSVRTVNSWQQTLSSDKLLTASFSLAVLSAIGFVAMLWPLIIDSAVEVNKQMAKYRSTRGHK